MFVAWLRLVLPHVNPFVHGFGNVLHATDRQLFLRCCSDPSMVMVDLQLSELFAGLSTFPHVAQHIYHWIEARSPKARKRRLQDGGSAK